MRRQRRFVPSSLHLEYRILLSLSQFYTGQQHYVFDGGDPTNHTIYGFPGMRVDVLNYVPNGYVGINSVTYTYTFDVLKRSPDTQYSRDLGKYVTMTSATDTLTGTPQSEAYQFYVGAEPTLDTYTLTIVVDANCKVYDPYHPHNADVTDILYVKVESPTVSKHFLADKTSTPNNPIAAWPNEFVNVDGAGNPLAPGTGTPANVAFVMAGPVSATNPAYERKWAGYFSTVNNPTHYDLVLAYVQETDLSLSYAYTNGAYKAGSGTDLNDVDANAFGFYYNQVQDTMPRQAVNFSFGRDTKVNASDSPMLWVPVNNTTNGVTGWLKQMDYDLQFRNNLVVVGGMIGNPTAGTTGVPIALSTALWHFNAHGTNEFNTGLPGQANLSTTLDLSNWAHNESVGAGTNDGYNGPWTAPGDKVRKLIDWSGTTGAVIDAAMAFDVEAGDREAGSSQGQAPVAPVTIILSGGPGVAGLVAQADDVSATPAGPLFGMKRPRGLGVS